MSITECNSWNSFFYTWHNTKPENRKRADYNWRINRTIALHHSDDEVEHCPRVLPTTTINLRSSFNRDRMAILELRKETMAESLNPNLRFSNQHIGVIDRLLGHRSSATSNLDAPCIDDPQRTSRKRSNCKHHGSRSNSAKPCAETRMDNFEQRTY